MPPLRGGIHSSTAEMWRCVAGTTSKAEIESTYKISRRIEAEERALEGAMTVFTSTQQEIDEQWGLYDA